VRWTGKITPPKVLAQALHNPVNGMNRKRWGREIRKGVFPRLKAIDKLSEYNNKNQQGGTGGNVGKKTKDKSDAQHEKNFRNNFAAVGGLKKKTLLGGRKRIQGAARTEQSTIGRETKSEKRKNTDSYGGRKKRGADQSGRLIGKNRTG